MTDSDDDEPDEWIRRVVAAAGRDSLFVDGADSPVEASGRRARSRTVMATAAIAVAGVAALLLVGALLRREGDPGAGSVRSPTQSVALAPNWTDDIDGRTVASETSVSPETSPTDVDRPTSPLLGGCKLPWVNEEAASILRSAYLWNGMNGGQVPVQVFAPKGRSIDGKFAVAVRVSDDRRFSPPTANAEVSGQPARVTFVRDTWGEVLWITADGSEAYLRTSTMTEEELLQLASTLSARLADATIPGFDSTGDTYALVDQGLLPLPLGPVAVTTCKADDRGWLPAVVVGGRPVSQALFLTDRRPTSADVRILEDGSMLAIFGLDAHSD